MPLKEYQKRTQAAYRAKQQKVNINLNKEKDAEIIEYLRSLGESDSDFPRLIKEILREKAEKKA